MCLHLRRPSEAGTEKGWGPSCCVRNGRASGTAACVVCLPGEQQRGTVTAGTRVRVNTPHPEQPGLPLGLGRWRKNGFLWPTAPLIDVKPLSPESWRLFSLDDHVRFGARRVFLGALKSTNGARHARSRWARSPLSLSPPGSISSGQGFILI